MPRVGQYPLLFEGLDIGPVRVKNRILFSAHLTNYAADGKPSDQHVAYYEARAAGGAGLIITEEHSTHPTDWPYEKLIHGFNPAAIEGYRRITRAVHRHGTPIFAQINHNGGQASSMYTRLPVWGPSPVPDPLFREVPKALSAAEIAEVIAGYGLVARHCRQGGFDGIELQCSHSSIVRGFLSRATNQRGDNYGGELANRARLLVEIIDEVRRSIGPEMALGVRLCGDELIPYGITIEEAVATARIVEATGAVDYINTSIGVATATLFMIEASMHVPPGYASFIPSAIREAVDLPVVGVGRFKDPLQAEHALADGICDLVGVVRGQIADPDFTAKARSGHTDDIRLCLSCNQECVGRMGLNRWLGCIENPATGRESVVLATKPPRSLKVLVVGAGPAGLQAAIAAAANGHEVVVHEQSSEPGGQVRLAASVANRAEFGDMIRNQMTEAKRNGVIFEFDSVVDLDRLVSGKADRIVIATGSRPVRPWFVPADLPILVADVTEVLDGSAAPTGRVVVFDELGFHQATSVAELLADRGCEVEVITPGMVVGQDLGITLDIEQWMIRATAKGITQTTDTLVTGVEGDRLALMHHPTGATSERIVDALVLCVAASPADELFFAAKEAGLAVERVGDAVAPRRASNAIIDGQRVGSAIGVGS